MELKHFVIYLHKGIDYAVQKYGINIKIKYQKMAITTCFSFKKGFRQLPVAKTKEVKESIMQALEIKGKMTWYARLNGKVEPRVSEAQKIEEIFYMYNITDIWGK